MTVMMTETHVIAMTEVRYIPKIAKYFCCNLIKKNFQIRTLYKIFCNLLHFLFDINICLPIRGIDSDVSGIFSAIANMKTENARSTVTPRAIFSPESGGKQNTSTVSVLIIIHGKTILYLKVLKKQYFSGKDET